MVAFVKASPRVRIILVEKTDRLYRNLKDWVMLDELDVEIHLVKEGTVLSRDSRSSEKFMHGIKVLMAKNYIDNLSEETRKGMLEKAEQGIWPSAAPLGYRNADGANGKRVIEPDPDVAPYIMKMFEWYAAGGRTRIRARDTAWRFGRASVVIGVLAWPPAGCALAVPEAADRARAAAIAAAARAARPNPDLAAAFSDPGASAPWRAGMLSPVTRNRSAAGEHYGEEALRTT